jgi:hypothetical protein
MAAHPVYRRLQAPRSATAESAMAAVGDLACQVCRAQRRSAQGRPASLLLAWLVVLPDLCPVCRPPCYARFPPAAARGPVAFGLRLAPHLFIYLFKTMHSRCKHLQLALSRSQQGVISTDSSDQPGRVKTADLSITIIIPSVHTTYTGCRIKTQTHGPMKSHMAVVRRSRTRLLFRLGRPPSQADPGD